MRDDDELVEELRRGRRYRIVLIVAAVFGIVTSTVFLLAYSIFQAFDGASGVRNPGALAIIAAPFATCMLVGYVIYGGLRWLDARSRRVRLPAAKLR